jgi:peroxiredoxin
LWLFAAGCGSSSSPSAPPSARPQAPEFTLSALSGGSVSLSQHRGKPVLVDFWATWCPPCRQSIPALKQLYADYTGRIEILGVSLDEDPEAVRDFVREQGLTYPILLGAASDVSDRYAVQGIPALFLLDKDGKVVRRWIGFDPRLVNEWRNELDALLAA